ncbi:hypothetical protein Patl1_04635 [Pistacia atlantica]|uniref:Uncharacterized protein n=1 Tax=Pistacia atlantica TaxID=434234 RepID=A0ACC1BT49_9ROSI|nr:hypothetical protein Patl1_04635 [Pistacia atlantica]
MLQQLKVDGCPNWTTPIIVEANLQDPPEFLHLQDGNDDIIPVTLVHGLQNLEDVELTGCAVQVVFHLEGVVAEGRKHKLSFPSLKNLKLKFLEKLEGLCMGLSLTHVPSHQNLTDLEVDSCSRLRYIFSATLARNMMQLKYLYISNCDELEQIIAVEEKEDQAFLNNNLQPETFQNLLKVEIKGCSKLKYLFPTTIARGLQQLEELHVQDNFQLEEVFGHKEVAGIMEDEEIVLPQLNYLRLRALPSITNFCPGGCHFKFPSLRILEFQDCGATVLIFSLTGDECVHADEKKLRVLHIGDCNSLCGGISVSSCGFNNLGISVSSCGFNNLEDLRIWNCRVKVVFQLGDLAVDGQSHQLSFPSLKKFDLRGLKELEGLCNGSQHVLSLQNLTTLNISYCDKLTCIFSASCARNMLQLRSLSVEGCKDLEQILVEDDDDHLPVLFPNLSQIHVKWCDKLKCIVPISIARGLQLQERDVRQNFQLKEASVHEEKANLMDEKVNMLPQLEELTIVYAPQLKSIFYFENVTEWYGKDIQLPKLRKLLFFGLANLISFCPENCHSTWPALEEFWIHQCPNLTMPFLDQVRVQNLMKEKLRVLCIGDCNNLCGGTSLFSCGFNNLEYLRIWNCGVKVVFQLGDLAVDGQSHQLSFPSLKKLDLGGLKELEGLCNGSKHVLSLQNLTTLSICSCHRLTHIFSTTFARNMLQLETLSVEGCMELQQIVVEDDDDDHLQSLFPNLSKIDVKRCNKLKCVLPITMARGLQQLKVVTVAWANQLEEVFGHTDRVDVMTDKEIPLPQLDELLFQDLPNLANFCPVGYHFIFPSLNTLIVERCPEMNTAFSLNQQNKFVHAEAQAPKISLNNKGVELTLKPPVEIKCWKSDHFPKVLPLRDEQTVTQQNDIEN